MSAADNAAIVEGLGGGETVSFGTNVQTVNVVWGEEGVEVPTVDSNVVSSDVRAVAVATDVEDLAVDELLTRTADGQSYRVAAKLPDETGQMVTLHLELTT